MYRLPPVHCLTAFEALARHRSVMAAAEELCVTPSAVSHRMRLLEDTLGLKLFERTQIREHSFVLTETGRQYLDVVRTALNRLSDFGGTAPTEGVIRLAAPPTFSRQLLMPRLPEFQAAFPEIALTLQVTIPLLDSKAERCDLEVRFGDGQYQDGKVILLQQDEVQPACSPVYWQRMGGLHQPAELARCHLLRSPLEPWEPWLQAAGLPELAPRDGSQYNDVGLLMEAAIRGQGVVLARHRLTQDWLRSGALQWLFDQRVTSPRAYYLVIPHASQQRQDCRHLVDWLVSSLAQDG